MKKKKRSKRLIQSRGSIRNEEPRGTRSIIGRGCVTPLRPFLSKPRSPRHNTWARHCDPITSPNHFCSSISFIFSFSSLSLFLTSSSHVIFAPMTLVGPVLQPLLVVSHFNVIRGSSYLSNCIRSKAGSIFIFSRLQFE